MRAVIQRVARASVKVEGSLVGEIGPGLLVLLGIGRQDGPAEVSLLVDKVVGLRIFPDDERRMNRSVVDVGGAVLVVSQFTLLADVRKGRRPSFTEAASPEAALSVVDDFVARLSESGVMVATGKFGAMMDVELVNDGPVTIVVDAVDGRIR